MAYRRFSRPLQVLVVTEGTYPFFFGGVSTWCDVLLRALPEVDFRLLSIMSDPRIRPLYTLPANVREFRPLPLWGIRQAVEARRGLGWRERRRRARSTTQETVVERFVPAFRAFLLEMLTEDSNPQRLAGLVHALHRFSLEHDFDTAFRSRPVWDCFTEVARSRFPGIVADLGHVNARFTLGDLTTGLQWLYHSLFPIAGPLPKVDLVHSAMAGVSTLVAACVKLEHGAAYLLTEHGIYLRECYLAEAPLSGSLFLKLLRLRFARRMTELSYALADQVSPCCNYNQRWERQNGAAPHRLKTMYYGVDQSRFSPSDKAAGEPPVVVWVGRINPLKDVDTLIRAAAIVHQERPDIRFELYGSPPKEDQQYYEGLLALRRQLGLEETVCFRGYIAQPEAAFNAGDLVVSSSISEGTPFSIIEAMLCAKPIVATAVGGVPEQIAGGGIAVEPRHPGAMAQAILDLMNDPQRCALLGQRARQRAVQEFSIPRMREEHLATYRRLAEASGQTGRPAMVFMREERKAAASGLPRPHRVEEDVARRAGPTAAVGTGPSAALGVEAEVGESTRALGPGAVGPLRTLDADAIAGLAEEVRRRVPQPIDWLEVTAVLESLGMTDEVARQTYGAADAFVLGAAVIHQMRFLRWQATKRRGAAGGAVRYGGPGLTMAAAR